MSTTDRPSSPSTSEAHATPASGPQSAGSDGQPQKPSRLWLWFVAAFVVQAAMWTALFIIASHNKVEEVPLVKSDRR